MCLLVMGWRTHTDLPFVVAANRDEFYARPSLPAHFWKDQANIFAGKDLQAGGSWLGVNTTGRFAAITNIRNPASHDAKASSRGELVSGFLNTDISAESYAIDTIQMASRYNGFNLILCDGHTLVYCSSGQDHPQILAPGIYALSNATLDTEWPKTRSARQKLENWLKNPEPVETLAGLLNNKQQAADHTLPKTGISEDMERALSAEFIELESYGTRCMTGLQVDQKGEAKFYELSIDTTECKVTQQSFKGFWPRQ